MAHELESASDEREEPEGDVTRILRLTLDKVSESLQVKQVARESVVRLVSQPHLAKRRK